NLPFWKRNKPRVAGVERSEPPAASAVGPGRSLRSTPGTLHTEVRRVGQRSASHRNGFRNGGLRCADPPYESPRLWPHVRSLPTKSKETPLCYSRTVPTRASGARL